MPEIVVNIGNVLSLFDGISCGQMALIRANINYLNYFASEIDKHAIVETMLNFPNTIHLGSVTEVSGEKLPKIDLLMGGSPCQGFSFSGKMLNFDDPRSKLFFEFVRLKNELKPKYFLLENVLMKERYKHIISEYLGVSPVTIDSSLVSAQVRKRLYWTNIDIPIFGDKGINLEDILEDKTMLNPAAIRGRVLNSPCEQYLEVKSDKSKSNCLTTVAKDNVLTSLGSGRYRNPLENKNMYRHYTLKEMCRLQTIPDDFFKVSNLRNATKMIGNAWTVDVIAHILSGIYKEPPTKLRLW